MATVTIPKEFAGYEELIAVPLESYEEFIAWERQRKQRRIFVPTAADKRALVRARRQRASGKYLTLDELTKSLERTR